MSDIKDNYQSVRDHLEDLGYKLENTTTAKNNFNTIGFRAKSSKNNFLVHYAPKYGFNFWATYKIKPHTKNSQLTFLEMINKMNQESILVKFFIAPSFEVLLTAAWYPDMYQTELFEIFLQGFENDVIGYFQNNPNVLDFIV